MNTNDRKYYCDACKREVFETECRFDINGISHLCNVKIDEQTIRWSNSVTELGDVK